MSDSSNALNPAPLRRRHPSTFGRLLEQANDGDFDGFMLDLCAHLNALLRDMPPATAAALEADPEYREIRRLTHQDPYTRRGFLKPRGYAGDAVLLDYIYGTAPMPEDTTAMGASILASSQRNSLAFQAVRERRGVLARHMSRAKQGGGPARCLAVACGHLRELALVDGGAGENLSVVAMDQDASSLAVARATYGPAVAPVRVQIASLIADPGLIAEQFDLITVAGLYDYLDRVSANRLTIALAHRLKPGGRLVVSNFVDCWERGYMEYLMQWRLIYRSLEQVRAFAAGLDDRYFVNCSSDATHTIAYLQVDRA
jgi:SAM-dependent methyltransferase